MKKKSYSELTPEDIQNLKAIHKNISSVTIKGDDDQVANFIIKTPSSMVLDLVGHHGMKKDLLASNKALISNCVVAGDIDMMEADGGIYAALLKEINKLVKSKEVTVKKL